MNASKSVAMDLHNYLLYGCTSESLSICVVIEGSAWRTVRDGLHVTDRAVSLQNRRHHQNCRLLSTKPDLRIPVQVTALHVVNFKVKKTVNKWIYIALYYKPFISEALRYGPCVTRGSHSFTCHPHTNHTCLYSPASRRHRPSAGTHCAYPRRDGQAELTWVAGYIPR